MKTFIELQIVRNTDIVDFFAKTLSFIKKYQILSINEN